MDCTVIREGQAGKHVEKRFQLHLLAEYENANYLYTIFHIYKSMNGMFCPDHNKDRKHDPFL